MSAGESAEIVRGSEETVRRWLKRYLAEGVEGLRGASVRGAPRKVSADYKQRLLHAVRRRPRSLGLPFSLWTLRRGQTIWSSRAASGWSMKPSEYT